MLERLSKMQVEKVGRAGKCVTILRSRGDIRRQEIRLMQIEVGGPKTSRAEKIEDSHVKARIHDEDRPAIGAPSKGKAEGTGKLHAKNHTERGDCIRWITKKRLFVWRFVRIQT